MTTVVDLPSEDVPSPAETSLPSDSRPPRFNRQELLRNGFAFLHRALDFSERKYHRALGRAATLTPTGAVGGLCGVLAQIPLSPEQMLFGYSQGLFPMDKGGRIQWNCPNPRCALPLEKLYVPSRITRYLKKGLFELCFDRNPAQVLASCADRTETWLSPRLQAAYLELFELGALHTVEAYAGDRLVGGAFGVALGRVCTIESMFSHEDHASKLAFAYLCQHLAARGFDLADCQYQSAHVERFGAIEMPRDEYRKRVARGLIQPASFKAPPPEPTAAPSRDRKSKALTRSE